MIFFQYNPYDFAIHMDLVLETSDFNLGSFNFIIDDVFIPGKNTNFTLSSIVGGLKWSFDYAQEKGIGDIHDMPLSDHQLNLIEHPDLIQLNAGELSDERCLFRLGYVGEAERFFYTTDFGATFKEKRLPRGTVEAVVRSLPDMVSRK